MPSRDQKNYLRFVKKAMKGSSKAFGELIRQEQEYLYRMAFLYTRQEDDALDAVQESVLSAYLNIKKLREPEHFRTWLTRILINEANAIAKKRRIEENLESIESLPDIKSLSSEDRIDLYAAIDHLPDRYKQVIRLKYFDGLTIREIAARLNIPEGTVSSDLNRAVRQMRQELVEEAAKWTI